MDVMQVVGNVGGAAAVVLIFAKLVLPAMLDFAKRELALLREQHAKDISAIVGRIKEIERHLGIEPDGNPPAPPPAPPV
jgi:hypothetical protein